MTVSFKEYQEIAHDAKYAHFVHTNLHLHTPATAWDWNHVEGQTTKAEELTPEAYFNALNETSLELVAITDHNSIEWCTPLMRLAKEGRKKGTSNLHILPGVEITTYEGPHIIAIFDEDPDIVPEIKKMLIRLGMSGEGQQEDKVGRNSSNDIPISEVFNEICKLGDNGGLIIAPHVHSKDGLWGNKEFRSRSDILDNQRLRILATKSGNIKRVQEGTKVRLLCKNMDTSTIENSFAFINTSDCHRIEDFEVDTTWIKMCRPTLEGVKQIVYEPELRVAHKLIDTGRKKVEHPIVFEFCVPEPDSHPCILGIAISGGMLDGEKIAFSPHQNSIIGKNYAGKSAIIDFLRFALDEAPSESDENYHTLTKRLRGILTDGGQVRVYIRGKDGKTYGVSRTLSCSQISDGKFMLEGKPQIFTLWNGEFQRDTDINLSTIFQLEVYAQGEVVKIKDNASKQIKIVDALANLDEEIRWLQIEEINGDLTLLGELRNNSEEIARRMLLADNLSDEIGDIEQLRQEIEDLEDIASSPEIEELKTWSNVGNQIDKYIKRLRTIRNQLDEVDFDSNNIEDSQNMTDGEVREVKQDTSLNEFDPIKSSSGQYKQHAEIIYSETHNQIKSSIQGSVTDIDNTIQNLETLESEQEKRFQEIKLKITTDTEIGDATSPQAELLERIENKRNTLNSLEEKETQKLELEGEIVNLNDQRFELLNTFYKAWDSIRGERQKVVQLIDCDSAENIRAILHENLDREMYRELLDNIAGRLVSASNKIQNRKQQINLVVDKISPKELVEIVVKGNAETLVTRAGIKENTARILLGMGITDIHLLEECVLQDKFLVKFRKEGDSGFTDIDASLSGGEQALALISVAMIPKQMPLVIDQPEDELGPALITNELVEQIRKVKNQRQLLFVTHIANIPVLADSEQVIYVEQMIEDDIKTSHFRHQGSLDDSEIISHLLELDGGKVAFQKRTERYSSVIDKE